MQVGNSKFHFGINTCYNRINFALNEGGRFITFSFVVFRPEYSAVATTRGFIRFWFFGKEFIHWLKK